MTSHELARDLLGGPDLPVTRRGYEGGVDIIETVGAPKPIHLHTHDQWYYEYHEDGWCIYCDIYHEPDETGQHPVPTALAIHLS